MPLGHVALLCPCSQPQPTPVAPLSAVWMHVQFCPLGAGDDSSKRDVDTQLLLEAGLKDVVALARPKLDKAASAAIIARPQLMELASDQADPCSDLRALRSRQQRCTEAADRVEEAAAEGPEAYLAAQTRLDAAQLELHTEVSDARMKRRQLLVQVRRARTA